MIAADSMPGPRLLSVATVALRLGGRGEDRPSSCSRWSAHESPRRPLNPHQRSGPWRLPHAIANGDWRFIKRAAGRLRANTTPARDKRGRLPRIVDPIAQGWRMMDEAEAPAADALWVSRDGSACDAQTLRNIVSKRSAGPNGRPLSPHLFRSMAATSVSIEAPDSVDLIPAILSHRSHRTGEQCYNLASSLDASRTFGGALDEIRKELETALQESAEQEDRRR